MSDHKFPNQVNSEFNHYNNASSVFSRNKLPKNSKNDELTVPLKLHVNSLLNPSCAIFQPRSPFQLSDKNIRNNGTLKITRETQTEISTIGTLEVENFRKTEVPKMCQTKTLTENEKPEFLFPEIQPIRIETNICNRKIHALIDSGSQTTLISETLATEIFGTMKFNTKPTNFLKTANGESINVLGNINFYLNIGKEKFAVKANVVKKLSEELILGSNFLTHTKNNGSINFGTKCVTLRGKQYTFSNINLGNKEYQELQDNLNIGHNEYQVNLIVRAATSSTIPAMSEKLVPATVYIEKPISNSYLIEPTSFHENLTVAKSMFDANIQLIPVCIANVSNNDITVRSRQVLATAEPVYAIANKSIIESKSLDKHFLETINKLTNDAQIPETDKGKLKTVLLAHRNAFALDNEPLGVTTLVKHEINTGNAKPIAKPPFRTPIANRKLMQQEIEKMLNEGVISPSKSPWAAPMFLVKKKDGSWRPVIDYRGLNAVTTNDIYPIPRIDDYIDALGDAKFFSTLDLKAGYWQIKMDDNSKEKTGFICQDGHFQFNVMPFGLKNAPADFQRLIEIVLKSMNWRFALAYLDDIVIFSKTFDQHLEHLNSVFNALEEANLRLKPKKCAFLKEKIQFLGFEISPKGITPDKSKIADLLNYQIPKNKKELQRFLGLVQWFRRFVPDLAKTAAPLYELLKNKVPFDLTNERITAFEALKNKFTTEPIVRFPVYSKDCKFVLQTDASNVAIGAVLLQERKDEQWVVAYCSRQLTMAEKNYGTVERECLALTFAFEKFQHYIMDQEVLVESDHRPLSWMKTAVSKNNRIQKWANILDKYKYTIRYIRGKDNEAADFLSRLPETNVITRGQAAKEKSIKTTETEPKIENKNDNNEETEENDKELMNENDENSEPETSEQCLVTPDNITEFQRKDPFIKNIFDALESSKNYRKKFENFTIQDNSVYRIWQQKLTGKTVLQLVIPKTLVKLVLHQFHGSHIAGHFGIPKVTSAILLRYWWPTIGKDVQEWVKSCPQCQLTRNELRPQVPLTPIPVVGPWHMVSVDCLTLKPSNTGRTNLVVFCDYYTKWAEAFATEDITAETIAKLLSTKLCLGMENLGTCYPITAPTSHQL